MLARLFNRFFKLFNYFHDIFHFFVWDYQCNHAPFISFLLNISGFVADAAAVNPNGIKKLLYNYFSLTVKQLSLILFSNPFSCLIIYLLSPCHKIPLCSKDLITLAMYFFSMFVSISFEPITDKCFALEKLHPSSERNFG